MTKNQNFQTTPAGVVGAVVILVLGGVVLYAIVAFAIKSGAFIVTNLSTWGTDVDAEVMAVIVSVILTFAVTQWTTTRQPRRNLIEQTNSQKTEVYQKFMPLLAKAINSSKFPNTETDNIITPELATQFVTYGGNKVVKSFVKWKDAETEGHVHNALLLAGDLLLEIRKDLKMNNQGISRDDVARTVLKMRRQPPRPLDPSQPVP